MMTTIAWSVALVWFLHSMPTEQLPATRKAEALVVLTGGTGRVEHGFAMLAEGAAPLLFISGVGERVSEAQMLAEHASLPIRKRITEIAPEIVLDHVARSTVSNADQSVAFLAKRNIHRIRLITANYHMKRSLHEFRAANPDLEIIPDPVYPEGFERDTWWMHENTRRLVFSEFYKYFAVLLRDTLRPS